MTRTVTDAHKQAMQAGRRSSAAVDAYLKAIAKPKRRGRPVSLEDLIARRDAATAEAAEAEGIARLKLLQTAKDLDARIEAASRDVTVDLSTLEEGFIEHAASYGAAQGITYSTWREAGVGADVLKRAGIKRTRSR